MALSGRPAGRPVFALLRGRPMPPPGGPSPGARPAPRRSASRVCGPGSVLRSAPLPGRSAGARGGAAGGPSPARGPRSVSPHPGPVCLVGSSPPRAVLRVERRALGPSAGWLPPQGGREGGVSPLSGLQPVQVGPSPWGRRKDASSPSESSLCVLAAQCFRPIVTFPAGTSRSRRMKPLRQTHCVLAVQASVNRDRVELSQSFYMQN
jgi:hypothetical protein